MAKGEVLRWKGRSVGGKTIQIQGTRKLRKQLERLDQTMRKPLLERMVKVGGELVREVAAQKAPVGETATLTDNIIVEVLDSSAHHATAGIGPHKNAFYGIFQEYGTAKHGAQPFMRPAWDEKRLESVRVMAQLGRRAVERVARR